MVGDSQTASLGGGRFEVLRRLGAGGFGQVLEVLDRERDQIMALKVLERPDGVSLYRFKQEFRKLTRIHHPNLVRLHELHVERDRWFFTMELVRDGVSFREYVRPGAEKPAPALDATGTQTESVMKSAQTVTSTSVHLRRSRSDQLHHGPGTLDVPRLRNALAQLVAALSEVHRLGMLHCDVKPSNVLVEPGGRLVILDFGLVSELKQREHEIAGTPAYMSPEQAKGEPLTTASDWYSVGVMLHEALTGHRPFHGLGGPSTRREATASVTETSSGTRCMTLLAQPTSSGHERAKVMVAVRCRGAEVFNTARLHGVPSARLGARAPSRQTHSGLDRGLSRRRFATVLLCGVSLSTSPSARVTQLASRQTAGPRSALLPAAAAILVLLF